MDIRNQYGRNRFPSAGLLFDKHHGTLTEHGHLMADAADSAPRLVGIDTLRVHHDQIDRLRRRVVDDVTDVMPDDNFPLNRQPGDFKSTRDFGQLRADRFFQFGVEVTDVIVGLVGRWTTRILRPNVQRETDEVLRL